MLKAKLYGLNFSAHYLSGSKLAASWRPRRTSPPRLSQARLQGECAETEHPGLRASSELLLACMVKARDQKLGGLGDGHADSKADL